MEAAPEGEKVFEIAGVEPAYTPAPAPAPIEEPPSAPDPAFVQGPLVAAPEPPSAPVEPAPAAEPEDEVATPSPVPPVLDEIETPTMAELYASQGYFDRAVAVYRNLLVRSPNETQYRERIEELEMLANAAALPKAPVPPAESREPGGDGLSTESRKKTIGGLE